MPPQLALLLCSIFSFLLLKQTTKDVVGKSKGLWIPTIWVFICASRPVGRWLSVGSVYDVEISAASGSAYDQLVIGALIVLAFFVVCRRRIHWTKAISENRWALLLLLFMGLSIIWSEYAVASIKRYVSQKFGFKTFNHDV